MLVSPAVEGYKPRYSLTTATLRCAEALGAARATFELRPLPLLVERDLRHRIRVEVAHNSTWIENRTLALAEAEAAIAERPFADPSRAKEQAAQEVRNYFQALELIDHTLEQPPSERLICHLHATIMSGLLKRGRPPEASPYRRASVRVGVYLAPMWEDVPKLMRELVAWACGPGRELPGYLFAGIFAYQFVTIHPFPDGNGRTSRALATWALRRSGYDPRGLLNVEEFYARNLEGYYEALQMGMHPVYYESNARGSRSDPDLSPWLDFFCTAVAEAAHTTQTEVVRYFREYDPEALADPLAEVPANLRRVLSRLSDFDEPISVAKVVEWLSVSERTAREWFKHWQAEGFLRPARPDAQRVHAYLLSETWRSRLLPRVAAAQSDAASSGSLKQK